MRFSFLRLCVLLMMFMCGIITAAAQTRRPIVVGYVFTRNTVLQPGQVDPHKLTRVNYAFANIKNGRVVEGETTDAANFAFLTALRKQEPNFSVLISVGGWLWSRGFSDAALTPDSRRIFIDSAMEFITRYDLDGLDIDWEYPGLAGSTKRFRSVDKENFTELLKELRARFDAEGKARNRRYLLTIAAGSSDEYLEHTEMGKDQQYLDTVNLMAYDYLEPGQDKITGHHAPLHESATDTRKYSVAASVRAFEKAGVPAEKIVVGVPFYGHQWGEVADVNHGLMQHGKAIPHAFAPYHLIAKEMIGHGYVRYWDESAQAPYLYNADEHIFVTYDDPESLKLKCRYVLDEKLGGIMYWEHSSDTTGVLLGTIDEAFKSGAQQK